ncbi:plastocyanin/azurin family copper-binding protein [Comamonas sp. GB3 AK4-5]|uniref:cupredoxin domain-containing protein n=1 Tax=Comamonas sp. GB3 AK4-5 TaxID=3231487 RepID=UPI00351E1916
MKTTKSIAICAIAASAAAVFPAAFAHGNAAHQSTGSVAKEQKAWGIAGDAKAGLRTITLAMTDDMRFTPSHFSVKQGETVRLRVVNQGQLMHEVVLGTQDSLKEHAQTMLKFPGMEHAEPFMAHVAPGRQEDLVWNFNRAGSFDFACLIPGHYQAGMAGRFTVTP